MSVKSPCPKTKKKQSEQKKSAEERRKVTRTDTCYQVSLLGNYGTFAAIITNLSYQGALVEIALEDLKLSSSMGGTELINQTLQDQFEGGLVICFTGTDFSVEADIVRTREKSVYQKSGVILGCRFRRDFTREESMLLQVELPPPAPSQAPALQAPKQVERIQVEDSENKPGIRELMAQSAAQGATDLHIKVGCRPHIRISGSLFDLGSETVSQEIAHAMAMELMTQEQITRFDLEGDVELTSSLEDVGRFRINIFRQLGFTGLAIRCIPDRIPTIEDLGLSSLAKEFAEKSNGIVLVTGPTGSGKSTTLASMIHHINTTRACNILTMEDPIEYVHKDVKAQINQRQIGIDVLDFSTALKRGLRQDPDVIMVGEMRDLETISLALTAAETGHLVFATLHTTSAAQTPARIIDVFPSAQHQQIRVQLADSLQGIMAQILVPRLEGGLVLAQEVLVATDGVRALIRDNKTTQIENQIQTGGKIGMQTLETALNRLVQEGVISFETALAKANKPKQITEPAER